MLPPSDSDRIRIAFDDHRLVANAGLILPVTLAQRLGLRELASNHVDLGNAPGRANPGDKMLPWWPRRWLAATALTTLTCCAPAVRLAPSAAWSRRRPSWEPSCAASGGATSANWTGLGGSCWRGLGPLGPAPATGR